MNLKRKPPSMNHHPKWSDLNSTDRVLECQIRRKPKVYFHQVQHELPDTLPAIHGLKPQVLYLYFSPGLLYTNFVWLCNSSPYLIRPATTRIFAGKSCLFLHFQKTGKQ